MPDDEKIQLIGRNRHWHGRRDIRFLLVVAVCFGIFIGYGFITGPSRITDRLHKALEASPEQVNIVVTAKFPPEEFHMGIYQDVGAMRGSEGRSSTLFRVKPRNVKALARHYWIERIDLAPLPK